MTITANLQLIIHKIKKLSKKVFLKLRISIKFPQTLYANLDLLGNTFCD